MNIIKKINNSITLPKLKKCPYCFSINILKNRWNDSPGVPMAEILSHDSYYIDLSNWILKKKFNCRSCKIKLGFFIHSKTFREAIVWLDYFVYSGVTKPFLEQENYKFLNEGRKKNGFKEILKTSSVLMTIFFSFFLFVS